jgi:D-sedoheptulose 7-phosphate isomerase
MKSLNMITNIENMDLMPNDILERLIIRYPVLCESKNEIEQVFTLLCHSFENGGKLLVCGNGGSASDSEHIVGELMKSFSKKRSMPQPIKDSLKAASPDLGSYLAESLQPALPAIALTNHAALTTAFSNDVDPTLIFAQQVLGYGKKEDVFLGISTSGNANNVLNAFVTAKALGMKTIGLTGKTGGRFIGLCDALIRVDATSTPEVQELHLPVYHALCQMLEEYFF